jgi:hypothetical protein
VQDQSCAAEFSRSRDAPLDERGADALAAERGIHGEHPEPRRLGVVALGVRTDPADERDRARDRPVDHGDGNIGTSRSVGDVAQHGLVFAGVAERSVGIDDEVSNPLELVRLDRPDHEVHARHHRRSRH